MALPKFKLFVVLAGLVLATQSARAEYRDLGSVANLELSSVALDCTHRFKMTMFARTYYFSIVSVVEKQPVMEAITFSADPFVEMRSTISRADFGLIHSNQLGPDFALAPTKYSDPQLRLYLGRTSSETKVFLDFNNSHADPDFDLPGFVRISPSTLTLEEQCQGAPRKLRLKSLSRR